MKAALLNKRYRILETLGRGGFGETYLAEDTHMPSGRKCVIKQLKPVVQQPRIPLWMKERFQREAAILEELGEGNDQIPRLYAYFSEEDKFYLVQEWIEGQTLAQKWSSTGNLDAEQVIGILVELLPVLDYIHERRIVHRDIKPENIILRDRDLLPVLIDFGAVKEAMATVVQPKQNAAFSVSIGTPGYMPSEQAAGRPAYSSDLYSLGLIAIFLLTGKSPQDLEVDPQTGEIIWQEYAPHLDAKLSAILDRAIRFHPRDRFFSAREMLAALQSSAPINQLTGATIRVAPGNISSSTNYDSRGGKNYTVASKKVGLIAVQLFKAILMTVISIGGYLLIEKTLEINKIVESLETQYQLGNYQHCFQLALDNPERDHSKIQEWIGKCGLEAVKAKEKENNLEGYLSAIAFAEIIPNTVPNYQEVRDKIDNLAGKILEYATKKIYQEKGKLSETITILTNIPENTHVKTILPVLITQFQNGYHEHQAILDKAQNLLNQAQGDAAKQEIAKIPPDFVFWQQKAQPILNEANRQIEAAAAAERLRRQQEQRQNFTPNYILQSKGKPDIAVFEPHKKSFALGCPEIRNVWSAIPERRVESREYSRILSNYPVVADLSCEGNGNILARRTSDEGPSLLLIKHREGNFYRHYIDSSQFFKTLNTGEPITFDGSSFRNKFPRRGIDFKIAK